METAAQVILDATLRHVGQRMGGRLQCRVVPRIVPVAQQQRQPGTVGKLRALQSKPSEALVVLTGQTVYGSLQDVVTSTTVETIAPRQRIRVLLYERT